MTLQYFNLLTLKDDFFSLCGGRSVMIQIFFRGIRSVSTAVGLTLVLASCGEKPPERLQISSDFMLALSKQMPSHNAAIPTVVNIESDFDQAILQAVENSEEYRAALSSEREMMTGVGVAESVRRWQVTGTSTVGGMRERGGTNPSKTSTGIAGGIQASNLLYDGGASVANINSATAEAAAAVIDRIIIGNKIALEAASAWINAAQYEARLDLLSGRSVELQKVVAQIERMSSNGMMDRAAVDSVLRKVVAISLEQTRLQLELSQAQVRFARFFNQEPTELKMPVELVSMSDARAQAGAWQDAPETQRSAVELIVAQNSLVAAKAAFKPKAKFQAGVTSPMQRGESTDLSLGVGLQYTFSDGGRRKSQLDAAEARLESVKINLRDIQRSLEVEIKSSIQQLSSIEKSMPLVARQVKLSASAAKTARSQLATGQANLNEVVEAKIENYRAEDKQINMRAERLVLQLVIASRTGLLGKVIGLPTDIAE